MYDDDLKRLLEGLLSTVPPEAAPSKIQSERAAELRDAQELEKRAAGLQAAARLSHAAPSILDLDELLPWVVELIHDEFDCDFVGIFLMDDRKESAVLQAATGEAGRQMIEQGHRLWVGGDSMVGWCLANQQARLASDIGEDAVRSADAFMLSTRSAMALPLLSRGHLLGAMTVQSAQPAAFSEQDLSILQIMADQLANAIDDARLHTETTQRTAERSAVLEASAAISSSLDLQEALAAIAEQMAKAIGVDGCTLFFWDREADAVVTWVEVRMDGQEPDESGTVYALADFAFVRRVLEERQPHLISISDHEADPAEEGLLREQGFMSLLMLPLIVGGHTLGLIELEASQSDHCFAARELDRLTVLAGQAAAALENAHLFEEAQQTSPLLAGSVHEVTARVREFSDADTLARAEAPELDKALGRPAISRQRRADELSQRPVAQQGHDGNGGRRKPSVRNRTLDMPRHWLIDKFPAWLPPLVIVGVLLLSLALPLVAPQRYWPFLIGLPIALGVILAFMLWPPLGLLALVATALVVPSPSLPGGLNVAVLFLALLTGLWLVHTVLEKRGARLVPSPTVKPLLGLVLVAVLAFGIGHLPWFAVVHMAPLDAQLGGLAIFVLSVGAFLLVAHQVRDLRWLELLTWLFLALGALFIAGFIAGWLVPGLGGITSRLFQLGAISNSMFWVWLLALAFSQAWLNRRLHLGWRLALAALVVATLYVALVPARDWKSGWMPPLVAIAVIIGLRSWRAALALALLGLTQAKNIFSTAIASDEYSYSTRLDAWEIMLEMIKTNPATGFGPANYYWYTRLYRIRGWDVEFNSHNQYIDIVAQTGLLGLACVLWFFWEVGRLGWRLRTRVSPGFAEAYVYGALGGLAGTLAAGIFVDWFLPFVYNVGLDGFRGSMLPWLFLGGLVSLEQITQGQAPAQVPEPGTV